MRWPQDAAGWPLTEHSRFVLHRPHRWHVQEAGAGDTLLLLHGAGAATQSWRALFPILMQTHRVVAIDLPGQGFTQLGARGRCGVDAMAADILSLMRAQGWQPAALIGHSAGAAIALRLAELGALPEGRPVIGINAALGSFKGIAGWLFPLMANALAVTPFAADLFAAGATEAKVRSLLERTGSRIDETGVACYLRLARDRAHVDATLAMMAQWRLEGVLSRLPSIAAPVTLIAGAGDLTVPPATSTTAAQALPHARVIDVPRLGHLMHEEDAAGVAALIRAALG